MSTLTIAPSFFELFGHEPQITLSCPGRVNLMGDHTDYNGGYVLPTVIPQETYVQMRLTPNHRVRLYSAQISSDIHEYTLGEEHPLADWTDYIQGLTWVLEHEGVPLQGFDLKVHSEVPVGSGLSSSAALEMAVLRGLREILNLPLNDVALALIGQRAENEFVGAPVGIMDQMACLLAQKREALFLNTADLSFRMVALPKDIKIAVVFSGITHNHAEGDYRTRRNECEKAARLLGVERLCELLPQDRARIERLPEPLNRRVRHVLTENQRVIDMVEAFRFDDRRGLKAIMEESHRSLKDDYEVSVPEIDYLVDQAKNDPAIIGARMTGGGFGGCIVLLVHPHDGAAAVANLVDRYRQQFDFDARILVS